MNLSLIKKYSTFFIVLLVVVVIFLLCFILYESYSKSVKIQKQNKEFIYGFWLNPIDNSILIITADEQNNNQIELLLNTPINDGSDNYLSETRYYKIKPKLSSIIDNLNMLNKNTKYIYKLSLQNQNDSDNENKQSDIPDNIFMEINIPKGTLFINDGGETSYGYYVKDHLYELSE